MAIMGRSKKRPTFIKSLRVEKEIKDFLESLENANDFLVLQIKNSQEFKEFLLKKQDEGIPSLPLYE